MHEWKSWLKGIYDVEGIPPGLIVTGSAGLDAFRKVGDSLARRQFQFRLHPIDLKEAHRCQDVEGDNYRLHSMRNKDGQEIDFSVTRANKPEQIIEVKWADSSLSPHFEKFLPGAQLTPLTMKPVSCVSIYHD